MLEHLNDEVLSAYAVGFYGYGSSAAPYWFIGMEEGGGDSIDEIKIRSDTTSEAGGLVNVTTSKVVELNYSPYAK
jgi:hypothetical protein